MKRLIGCGALLLALASSSTVSAQVMMHREVPRGEVTGLEMGIDGALSATPGGHLRWWTTLFEVVARRDLRPSPGSELRVLADYARDEPVLVATTDASGRAQLDLTLPPDLTGTVHFVVEAISPRGVRRLFDVDVAVESRHAIELYADRSLIPVGGSALFFGRVMDRASGQPVSGQELSFVITRGGPHGAPRTLVTDAAGVFVTRVSDVREGGVGVQARYEAAAASADVRTGEATPPRLLVTVVPERTLVAPGTVLDLDVEVRTPEGLPVEGAEVEGPARVPPPRGETLAPIRTDARGHATYPWMMPMDASAAAVTDVSADVRVTAIATGSGTGHVVVRVSRRDTFAALAVEGGALVPELGARVYARVVSASGAPRAAAAVQLSAPSLGGVLRGQTDARGIATFDVTRVRAAEPDECGGSTATRVEVEVDGERSETCLRVDPDAPLTVRAPPLVAPGGVLRVEIARRAVAARAPVVVTLLEDRGDALRPLAETLAGAGAAAASLTVPREARGEVVVRARMLTPLGQAIRGGSTRAAVRADAPGIALRADASGATLTVGASPLSAVVIAAEEPAAETLEGTLRAALVADRRPLGDEESGAALAADLATRVPTDRAAALMLQAGQVVPQAMPEEPVSLGLLRDPWRTRARFVRGRIGRMMLAVEQYVDQRVAESLGEVAVRQARGWAFNREMLEGALNDAGITDEGAASLDGEPLDIHALGALDPSFTYDSVARRITRRRLWQLLVALHNLVRERELELPWARRGDPRTWIASLPDLEIYTEHGEPIDRDSLFDGWGQPMVLRPVRGRPRFAFLPPISGWELISIGPDGREGTADDLVDPFARVLPSGSLYAEAVGEDALVARVSSVALGRATLGALAQELEMEEGGEWADESSSDALSQAWTQLPAPLPPIVRPRAWSRPVRGSLGGAALASGAERRVTWSTPDEPRGYGALAIAFAPDGGVSLARARFEGGVPLVVRAVLPDTLRVGETVRVPVEVIALEEETQIDTHIEVRGDALRATLGPMPAHAAGQAGRAWLELRASAPGAVELEISGAVRGREGARLTQTHRVRVLPAGALRGRHSGALFSGRATLTHDVEGEHRQLRAELVLATPRALSRSALIDSASPAIRGWAAALFGAPDPELLAQVQWDQLESASSAASIGDACALVMLGASPELAPRVASLTRIIAGHLPSDLRERSAMLVALASVAPTTPGTGADDALGRVVAELREDGWRALASERDSAAIMARAAAGLLLVDREDGPGRALMEAAIAALVDDGAGDRMLPGNPARRGDAWVGTLALAIAARQSGRDALADELARASGRQMHLARRLGDEGAFWLAAASVYGALGVQGASAVTITTREGSREVALVDEVARIDLPAGAEVTVQGDGPLVAVFETRIMRPHAAREGSELRASIEGDLGGPDERSALELVVQTARTEGDPVEAPIVELHLPSLAAWDASAREALMRSPSVRAVRDPDPAGVVRIELSPLRVGTTHRLPLALRWMGEGEISGLAMALYDASRPGFITTTAALPISLAPEPSAAPAPQER